MQLFWDFMLHILFYRGRLGEVYFDQVHNKDGSINVPDGHLIVRASQLRDDGLEPGERKPRMISFSFENRWQVRRINSALTTKVFTQAMLHGLNPMRVIWESDEEAALSVTPYDGIEKKAEIVRNEPLLTMPDLIGLPAYLTSPFKTAYNVINCVKMPDAGLPNFVGRPSF